VVQWEEQRKENFVLTSYQEENRRLVVRVTSKYMRFMQFIEFLKKDKKSHYLDCCSFLFRCRTHSHLIYCHCPLGMTKPHTSKLNVTLFPGQNHMLPQIRSHSLIVAVSCLRQE